MAPELQQNDRLSFVAHTKGRPARRVDLETDDSTYEGLQGLDGTRVSSVKVGNGDQAVELARGGTRRAVMEGSKMSTIDYEGGQEERLAEQKNKLGSAVVEQLRAEGEGSFIDAVRKFRVINYPPRSIPHASNGHFPNHLDETETYIPASTVTSTVNLTVPLADLGHDGRYCTTQGMDAVNQDKFGDLNMYTHKGAQCYLYEKRAQSMPDRDRFLYDIYTHLDEVVRRQLRTISISGTVNVETSGYSRFQSYIPKDQKVEIPQKQMQPFSLAGCFDGTNPDISVRLLTSFNPNVETGQLEIQLHFVFNREPTRGSIGEGIDSVENVSAEWPDEKA